MEIPIFMMMIHLSGANLSYKTHLRVRFYVHVDPYVPSKMSQGFGPGIVLRSKTIKFCETCVHFYCENCLKYVKCSSPI
jgi:hypothetical protein